MNNKFDLTKGSVNKLILKLSLPIMLAGFIRTSYNLIDTIFASRLGGVEIAAVAFVGPLFMIFNTFSNGLSIGGSSLIAKMIGEKDFKTAGTYANQLRYIIILFSIIISLSGFLFSGLILKLLGTDGELFNQAFKYSQIIFLSIPFALIPVIYVGFYKSQGKMSITIKLSIIAIIGNSLLNAFFIFILKTGIEGLAYGTLITRIIQSGFIIWDYHNQEHAFILKLNPFTDKPDFRLWKKIFQIGLPISFSSASTSFGFILINSLIIPFGYQVVAAFAIGNRINSLFFAPTLGVGEALTPIIAQNWGKGELNRLKDISKKGLIFGVFSGLIGAVIIQFLINPVGTFLSKGDNMIFENYVNYISLVSWSLIAWGVFQSLIGIFNGFQKTKISMFLNIFRLWGIRIPAILIFSYVITIFGEYGIWYTMFYSNILTAVFALFLFFIYIPKRIYGKLSLQFQE